jgi:integrase
MSKRILPDPNDKPSKPRPDFPLFPHANGCWAKKIKGRLHYFGVWDDPDGALKKYLDTKDDLYAGRVPRPAGDACTLRDLVNRYLTHKQQLLDAGEIASRTFGAYYNACGRLVDFFGRHRRADDCRSEDFEALRADLAKRWGPLHLGNEIARIRSVFRYGYEAGLIAQPMRFGPGFRGPSRKTIRLNRAAKGERMFEPEQLRKLLAAARQPLRTMILLGVNCGFGNTDIARLSVSALDLERGWVNYPRPKTGIPRRCPLWPETVAALREVLARRPQHRDPAYAELVFLTQRGLPWIRYSQAEGKDGHLVAIVSNAVTKETAKLLKKVGINGHRGFYALRHTFETIGGESRDQPAVDHIMGHARDDMASVYRERISDDRLRAVTETVRKWLFGETGLARQ